MAKTLIDAENALCRITRCAPSQQIELSFECDTATAMMVRDRIIALCDAFPNIAFQMRFHLFDAIEPKGPKHNEVH